MRTPEERVRKVILEKLPHLELSPEDIVREAHIVFDLDFDSLDVVEFVLSVEDEFDIDIPDGVADDIETIGDVVRHLEKLMA